MTIKRRNGLTLAGMALLAAVAALAVLNVSCDDDDDDARILNIAGRWAGTIGSEAASMALTQSGGALAGTLNMRSRDLAISGTISGATIALVAGQNGTGGVTTGPQLAGAGPMAATPTPTPTPTPSLATPTPTPGVSPTPTPTPRPRPGGGTSLVTSLTLDGQVAGTALSGTAVVNGATTTFSMAKQP